MRRKRRKDIKKSHIYASVICLCLLTITVGYSLLSTTLKITGKTNIQMNWNILISNVKEAQLQGATNHNHKITGHLTSDFSTTIQEKGGYVIYDVTVQNHGAIAAILKEIKGLEEANNSGDLIFTVLNTDIEDIYPSKESKTFQIKVEAKPDVESYPVGPVNLNLELVFEKDPLGTGDITPPEIHPTILSTKTNAITIDSGCKDPESGIQDYQYKINEQAWVKGGNIYTFTGLKTGIYQIQVQCQNGMNLTTESNEITASTIELKEPTMEVSPDTTSWTNLKTVLLTYNNSQEDFNYHYSLDDGLTWIKVTEGNEKRIEFKENGSIIAKIDDGTNEKITSKYVLDKIDSMTPTTPTITGGSDEWSQDKKTITINTPSTSLSGIKNYQYYVSTSNTSLENGTWIDMSLDSLSIDLDTLGVHYVYIRAINNAGTPSDISEPQTIKVDSTAPTDVQVNRGVITSKSIEVSTHPIDNESGITKVEFSKDGGTTWISNGTKLSYIFENLTSGTYDIKVRVTNGSGLTTTSELVSIPTTEILIPTYHVEPSGYATKKVVTVTYPERQPNFIYEYSIDGGSTWIVVEETEKEIEFTANGTIIARVRDGINTVTASSYTVDKIDSEIPTAPVITGGSTSWTSGSRTIRISKASTSSSGIKNYQYYLSTSSTSQVGGSWTDLSHDLTTLTISENGIYYVFIRAVNNVGTVGAISTPETVKIDSTGPSASLAVTDKTTKSISLTATCIDNESGITKYEFSKDDGTNWTSNGTTKAFTFEDLTTGTYTFKVRCTNGSGLTKESESLSGTTNEITAPTYSINTTGWATSKTLTITYPERQPDFIYEYSMDGGSTWITVSTGTIETLHFTESGSVIARVRDGVNTKTASTYTVDKIDTGKPTTPVITGGSDTWSSSEKTISVSTESMSTSGIKNYQYYISTSKTSQEEGTWTNLPDGVTSVDIHTNGIRYIFMRAVNHAGTISEISNVQETKIDTNKPTNLVVNNPNENKWSKTTTITLSAQDNIGVVEYEWYDNDSWTTRDIELNDDGTASITFSTTRNSTIRFRAKDAAGNTSSEGTSIVKVDADIPTAPVITGGSTTWINGTRTISVSNASTSASGIKNYQYYISTSSTSQIGGTWIDLASGTTGVKISEAGTKYIFMRAINHAGTIGTVSSAETTKIDTTAPVEVSVGKGTVTTKSIQVIANGTDAESGITKYEFSKDNGSTWINNGTTKNYTFSDLKTGTYNIKVRLTNSVSQTTTSEVLAIETITIPEPTYQINTTEWSTKKTVTITYPTRQTDFIYEYSIDGGSTWITVPSETSAIIEFTSHGSVIARIRDGVNTKTASTYTVDKIDTGAPSAPTLTGGSDTWSSSNKTIRVATASTSTSGVKNYQYYISTSSTSQTGGSWTDLGHGITSVDVSTNGVRYIFMRAVNPIGTLGEVSLPQTTKIDTGTPTAPTITGGNDSWTISHQTIRVTTESTSTSGIKNYQYYISTSSTSQTGGTWINLASGTTSVDISANGTRYIFMRAVNHAGTVGTISLPQTTKIDTSVPTAPTLTGGSTTWINGTRAISVSTASTSPSGIKNYQYYISTSNNSQTGGTWVDLASGTTSVTISTSGVRYIFMRAINNIGTLGEISLPQTTKIDTTGPSASLAVTSKTTKSILLTATCADNESGITKYEFSKDDGTNWTANGTTKTFTFGGLTTGTYTFKVRCTNGSGIQKISDAVSGTTNAITAPTYSINTTGWATSKTVTITYPERQTDFIYEYSIDGGSTWITLSSGTTETLDFTANGSVIARVRDGVNTKTASTYTVDKIDTGAPTAPGITGGSTTWINGTRTISVSTASTSTSGIKNYQYYISTSSTSQTGGTWTDLAAGTTSVTISTNGTRYIFMRAVNNAGTAGVISTAEITKIDTGKPSAPTLTGGSDTWSASNKAISVSTESTSTSGIKNYQYYISTSSTAQTGGTWTDLSSGTTSVTISTNGTRYIFMRAVNNAGTVGNVSGAQTTKIDTGTPTAPTLTGGSTTWINGTRIISVSTASTSASGIKNYQYYISTSSTSQTGGTWTDLTSGTTKVTISTAGTRYIFMRAINNVGKTGMISAAETTKIDTTAPTSVSVGKGTVTTKSIQVTANGTDAESGITKYEFSKDNGTTWINNGTTKTYTFSNLTTGTYNIKVRLTNSVSQATTSDVLAIATTTIPVPTYSINTTGWATSKTVTITYPARQTDFVYEYSTDGGTTWTTVSSGTTASIKFTANGNVIARIGDGVNTKTASTYTVDKIDTGTPTAPTITGGSTTWINGTRTISVSTASTSTSGIKNYQYYISTSSTSQAGGTWTNLASGTTSVSISTNGTRYIFMRAVNNAGTAGNVSAAQTTKIDTGTPTAPTLTGGSTTWINGTRTISVSTASTSTSGIKNYQYYISTSSTSQAGGTWTNLASGTTSVSISTNGTRYIFMRAVNNAGTAGSISAAQTTKIDTGTPTAPTLTGGSTTWINGTRTISVSTASTSPSGIKNYQYYISTSSTSQTGGTWTDLTSGTTKVTISTAGTRYIFMRAVNNLGTVGSISAAATTKIDTTAPTGVSVGKGTVTTKSIQVTANGTDAESGITKYEFSKDNGTTWISNGTTKTYTFSNLTTGTYNIKVRLTNSVSQTTTSAVLAIATNAITAPTYSINTTGWATNKTVTITYPARQTDFVYEYSTDGGTTWTTVSSGTTTSVKFTANGSVIARIRDGVNTKTASTYTVDKIDTGTPTAPGITGGSTSWSATAKTISVSTASTSTSGIKNYQYYISTSSTSQTGGTWTNLASGTTSVSISTNGTRYIFMRAVNNAGTAGNVSAAQTTKIDTGKPTAPTITGGSTSWINGTRTISVSTASTSTSGIKNYQYYISTSSTSQAGGTWTNLASGTTSVSISTNGTRYIFMRAVNNAGTAGNVSAAQTTKIDTGTPTAPTLTGGSTSWINGTRIISVSTASTSASGIKNYQYYISTSNTSQAGGAWTDLASGTTSVTISTNGTRYIFMRAINNVGKTGTVSAAQTTKIDTTAPSAGLTVSSKTTKSISLTATCTDNESGITKYEFSKDNGSTWTANGTTKTMTFGSLSTGTYNFKVRCTNGSGIQKISDAVSGTTNAITAPTYSINTTGWATSKTVTITYPARQTDFVYEYSINGGSTWITVSSGTTASVKFTANGSVIARIRDGVNTKTASTYTVDKIDTGTPTAPGITGGSTTWINGTRTISVSTASTSTSGIKNYQYYISTSSTSQAGGTWTNLASGTTSVSISTNGTRYIFMRAVNNAGTAGAISAAQTTKIDTGTPTAPAITGGSTSWSTSAKTISVSTASTSTSGIKNYQYYISTASTSQTGGSWTNLASGTTSVSISTNGTRYIFMRAVNNAGTAGNVSAAQTTKIDTGKPTCSISVNTTATATSVTLTVSGSDGVSGLNASPYSWTSASSGFGTGTTKSVSANGTYSAWVKDAAGNVGTCSKAISNIKTTYNITYNLDGGTNASTNTATYNVSTGLTLANPTKTGYTFQGWYTDSSFTNKITSIAAGSTGDKTVYAKWSVNTLSICYKPNGGSVGTGAGQDINTYCQPAAYGEEFNEGLGLINYSTFKLTKTGYHEVDGKEWCTNADGTGTCYDYDATLKAEDIYPNIKNGNATITLYANWTINVLTICYNKNGGTASSTASSDIATTCHKLNYGASLGTNGLYNQSTFGLSRSGYKAATGNEWGTTASGGTYFDQDKVYTASQLYSSLGTSGNHTLTLYAKWWIDTTATGTANAKGYKMKMHIDQISWTRVQVTPMVIAGSAANSSGNANGRLVTGCSPGTDGDNAMPVTHNSVFNFSSKGTTYYFNKSSYATQTSSSNTYYKGATNSKGTKTTCTTSFKTVGTTTYLGSQFSVSKTVTMPSG